MRKIRLINTLIAASLMTAGLAHAATTTVNGGTVHFKGEVVNAACAVDAGSVDQTVQLGQVKTATLSEAGKTSSAVGFNIQLNDCDTTVAKTANIGFSGVNAGQPTVLALESSSAGGATNVGVQVLDRSGAAVTFDGNFNDSGKFTLADGTNSLPFQARYYATGAATPGTANANANFKVQYE